MQSETQDSTLNLTTNMTCSDITDNTHSGNDIAGFSTDNRSLQNIECRPDVIDYEADIEQMEPDSSSESEDDARILINKTPKLNPFSEQNSDDSIRNWLQKITQAHETSVQMKLKNDTVSSPEILNPALGNQQNKPNQQPPTRIMKYQDLPYMGEMTLDNSKPRRGRKPKKADICHLIYKNYGTILPGTPNAESIMDRTKKSSESGNFHDANMESFIRSNIHSRINSLLEKRLTDESKRHKAVILQNQPVASSQNEPLNLCIRDLHQLNIRLSPSENRAVIKTEPFSDDDVEFVQESVPPLQLNRDLKASIPQEGFSPPVLIPDSSKMLENSVPNTDYVYWPNTGVFIHPIALQQQLLYYQKLRENNFTAESHSDSRGSTNNNSPEQQINHHKNKQHKVKSTKTSETDNSSCNIKVKRNISTTSNSSDQKSTKRKRSAIFIPPIPSENQTNPATEVSICKFKFTGGAKPSLQEKKMLSVDSGGNFRYYSGTGDKTVRGYEFFPRKVLQEQISSCQGSSTGAFLQASGEKIYPQAVSEFPGKLNDFMMTPELSRPSSSMSEDSNQIRKRKSRKSLQREKLEQTFKEKGFLIQTQQLESAEGATYCKFRQLRKFTRYLFRSWKDYLPGGVGESGEVPKTDLCQLSEHDLETLSNSSQPTCPDEDSSTPS